MSIMDTGISQLELPIRLVPSQPWSEQQLVRFCSENRDLRVERTATGEIMLMSPTGSGTGHRNSEITGQLWAWTRQDSRGLSFDSNTGWTLPDGSMLSPGASWVSRVRWNALTPEQQSTFAPLCPEFLVELRSPTDKLAELQQKMHLWLANGAELAWLVDPERRVVEVYRPGMPVQMHQGESSLAGEGPVQGFVLELDSVWS